jgi:hypothetical protein
MKEMMLVGANLSEVIFHKDLIAQSSIARNAKAANHQASVLSFCVILIFLHGGH